jgi:Ala-tRNA(Pro) deacylase
MSDLFAFLAQHGIDFQRVDHPPVFTVEEAERLLPPMPGMHTKNLFLWFKKRKRHLLVVVGYEKAVDLKALAAMLGIGNIGFASPERLKRVLGVEPGSVSLLGLVNDTELEVEVILDEKIWAANALLCHPLVNSATLVISHAGIERFLTATNHTWRVIDVPARRSVRTPP